MISWKLISILATLNLPSLINAATDPANSNPKREYPEDNRSGNTTQNCQIRQRLSSHFLRIFPSVFSSPRTITVTVKQAAVLFPVSCELQISQMSCKYHPCHANILASVGRVMLITPRRCYLLECAVPTERPSSC